MLANHSPPVSKTTQSANQISHTSIGKLMNPILDWLMVLQMIGLEKDLFVLTDQKPQLL